MLKNISDKIILGLIITLIFTAGLGIGYYYHFDKQKAPQSGNLVFQESNPDQIKQIQEALLKSQEKQTASIINSVTPSNTGTATTSTKYVASKVGKRYYPVSCSAGQSLSEKNKIYFNSQQDAEKAGYTKSPSCSY